MLSTKGYRVKQRYAGVTSFNSSINAVDFPACDSNVQGTSCMDVGSATRVTVRSSLTVLIQLVVSSILLPLAPWAGNDL